MKTLPTRQIGWIAVPAAFLLSAFVSTSAFAALTVSPIFGSNMVLQRGTTVPVFGSADPGATVTVQFQSQNRSAVADSAGAWRVDLSSMPASASPATMTVSSGGSTISFTGVQVGEVWLCSGQSNMGKPLSYADGSAPYIADAPNHNIRLFQMIAGNGPSTTNWTISDSTTAANFSAVGYWMGLDLSEDLNVPIGLIQATHDGTSIDHWEHTDGGTGDDYDAMVKAIQPFAVKGVAWYQGESNGGDSAYQTKLTDMINEWRSDWGLPGLPFGIVQLPATKWTTAESAQLNVSQTVANTYLVVTSDLPGGNQLHPTAKYLVGIRCSIGARGSVYGESIEYSGPIRAPAPASYVSGNTVVINFSHSGNGLFTGDGLAPGPFAVADSGGRFQSANAMIVANTIQVSSSRVSAPTQVQYAFSGTGNLFNHVSVPVEGGSVLIDRLPASLFQIAVSSGNDTTPPGAPTGLTATAGDALVNLDWADNPEPDLASYNVKRSTTSGGPYTTIGTGVTTSAYADSNVNNGTTYYYVVSAVDTSSNESANSSEVSATPNGGGGCVPSTIHVASIVTGTWNAGQGNKGGSVQVIIQDNCGNAVPGVVVTGTFTGSFSEVRSGVTDGNGTATINTVGTKKGSITYTFCVNDVAGSLTYNPGDNAVTCGSY